MHSYAADPEGARKRQAEQVLRSIGALDPGGNVKLCPQDSPEVTAVRSVFPRVLQAAREEVRGMIRELEEKLLRDGGGNKADLKRMEKLQRARAQLEAWKDDGFLVVDVNSPNAFVHALVPRLIFIQRGLFWTTALQPPADSSSRGKGLSPAFAVGAPAAVLCSDGRVAEVEVAELEDAEGVAVRFPDGAVRRVAPEEVRLLERREGVVENEEQLAMLLGHELSHVVHDHAEGMTAVLSAAAGSQLVILALLDPTGLLSFLAEIGMAMTATYGFRLPRSRASELEADGTGLQIVARALYDPRDATSFFDRMLAVEAGADAPSWVSTHPRTEERLLALRLAEEEAVNLFEQAKARSGIRQVQ